MCIYTNFLMEIHPLVVKIFHEKNKKVNLLVVPE